LINTTRQIGGALGLAIMATVASSVAADHGLGRHSVDAALTSGYRAAFAIAGAGLVVGALLALLLPTVPTTAAPVAANSSAPGSEFAGDRSGRDLVVAES
jgi:hypothetical protein